MSKVIIQPKQSTLFDYVDINSALKYHLLDTYITFGVYFPLRWKRQVFDKYEQIYSV